MAKTSREASCEAAIPYARTISHTHAHIEREHLACPWLDAGNESGKGLKKTVGTFSKELRRNEEKPRSALRSLLHVLLPVARDIRSAGEHGAEGCRCAVCAVPSCAVPRRPAPCCAVMSCTCGAIGDRTQVCCGGVCIAVHCCALLCIAVHCCADAAYKAHALHSTIC